jgi:heparan-alpha-glucosaminide N-acetyltransferase
VSIATESRPPSLAVPAIDLVPIGPTPKASTRFVSLDIVKGLMLIASVGVNAWLNVPAWFDHAGWIGVHPMDWIFPTFVTLSGCGLAFANARRVRPWPAARRVVI